MIHHEWYISYKYFCIMTCMWSNYCLSVFKIENISTSVHKKIQDDKTKHMHLCIYDWVKTCSTYHYMRITLFVDSHVFFPLRGTSLHATSMNICEISLARAIQSWLRMVAEGRITNKNDCLNKRQQVKVSSQIGNAARGNFYLEPA